jgi:AraC-like DNA-binding protein
MQTTYVRQTSEPSRQLNAGSGSLKTVAAAPAPVARSRPSLFKARPTTHGNGDRGLIEALASSKVFQEYEKAFTEATGMPVALRPVETWQLPHHGKRNEGPFCSLISQKSRACASCLSVQENLSELASEEAHTMGCPNGLCDTAVPVKLGDRLIGFLQTGQVFRKKPTESQFERAAKQVGEWGVEADHRALHEAYFASRFVPAKQHEATVRLLTIFAQHLSMLSNQVVVQQENAEPPVITRAKEFIQEHQTENLRLGHVAKACNTSTFYFCKMFKKVTGINFTDYLSRVRIEKSKNLLLNPNLRVSEIAFEVGFQSLTHFNRVFKKILGQSPTEYRVQLLGTR